MAALQPGQMLGQYQITSQIGKGGMATVYKAYQASMDRYVALKVVSGQVMDDPNFLKRFSQEARLIAKLEHPHILPVHDFGEADGTPYMVMRFLEAGTLTERLEMGQLDLPEIDHIFSQLTSALGYAHENGVIHRDIKPSNAMLDKRGDVFLTDFGIAKMVEGAAGLTAEGAITGTPSYMSPEQAQGNKVDQRSDIYSLGVVLFEMLTGRVPFEAETPMAVLFKQILDPPPPLSMVRPDLPYTLEIVLLRAMSKKPEDRYATMGAFLTAWKNALAEAATSTPSAKPPSVTTVPLNSPVAGAVTQNTSAAATAVLPGAKSTPVKKGPNWVLLAIGIFAGLLVCSGVAAVLVGPLLFRLNPGVGGPTAIAQNTQVPSGKPSAIPVKGATSWVGANSVFSIAFRGDEVLTAGFGGVTIWKPDNSYTQLTTADGVPSANAPLVFVDTDGSLWVGSDAAGVAHLVGDKRTLYTAGQGLEDSYILTMLRSGERLLAGTLYSNAGGGLLEFDGKSWKRIPGFPSSETPDENTVSQNVSRIIVDAQGNLWASTESGVAMQGVDKKWKVFKTAAGLPDDRAYTVFIDAAGTLWVGTANGGAAKFNPSKQVFESFADLNEMNISDVYNILEEKDGTLWFVGGSVARYTPATEEWSRFTADNGTLPFYSAYIAGLSPNGTVYVGSSDGGLGRYTNGKFEKLFVPNALRFGQYGYIVPAPDGKLNFVQYYESGVDQFDPIDQIWSRASADLKIPRVFDAQGQLWSGGSEGLWVFAKDRTVHLTAEQDGLPSDRITAVTFNPDGTALVATDAGIVLLEDFKVKTIYNAANSQLISDGVYSLLMASDGSLWAITNGGFSRRLPDGTWEHFTSEGLFGNSGQNFYSLAEDQEGTIWVTSMGDGLYSFAKGKWKHILFSDPGVGLPSNNLTSIIVAPDGALWIGTSGQGAVRYDGKTWQSYGLKEGLVDLNINWIYVEPDAIWFTTNGGITRLEP